MADTTGIVLAAGAGTRAGGPKALLRMPGGTPWLNVAVTTLLEGGCSRVVVVLGAMARLARPLVPADERVTTVVAPQWELGMSESLRACHAGETGYAPHITLVLLQALPVSVVRRVLAGSSELRQATYDGRPGHPVYIAASHWGPVAPTLSGDRGARAYLTAHGVVEVECADLWDGADRDEG